MVKKGFTLIEILVVIGVFAVIAVIGSTSFFSMLKGATKTKITNLVKQNGDYTLGVMEKMIRNAREIVLDPGEECTSGMEEIEISNPDGGFTTFSCTDNPISSNSAKLISNQVKVESCFFDCQRSGPLQPDVVTINFTLSQAQTTVRPEEQVRIEFRTTVSLRNIVE